MVDVTELMLAIGDGDVTRDETIAAQSLAKASARVLHLSARRRT